MVNFKGSTPALHVFVYSQALNLVGVAINLSVILKLVTDWFPFSERLWALMACIVVYLLGALFIFLTPLLFDTPTLRPDMTPSQRESTKSLIMWDIKLMHFIMISLHFGCLLLVTLSFKRLFVDRRG